jgi:hypothetical protein
VPIKPIESTGLLQAAEKLHFWGFVTGHDFSRADKANRINWALAPANASWANLSGNQPFFRSLFSPEGRPLGYSPRKQFP